MAAEISHLESFLQQNPYIKFIRYQWIDYAGILRARVLPIEYCRRLVSESSPLAMSPVALTATTISEFIPGFDCTGVDHIYPDLDSLRPCLYAPGHASVMCFVNEGMEDMQFSRCPRTLLKSFLGKYNDLEIKAGFEVEFLCLNMDGTHLEECLKGFSTTAGLVRV
jgi:glutamine synthetase